MPINLAKNYVPLLDEVFQAASVTADLSGDIAMTREGQNANEIVYPVMEASGLGDYSRTEGYPDGSVNVSWKTAVFNYDRGVRFMVDAMDNQETFDIAFGGMAAQFERTRVAPEADAFCFSTLNNKNGILKHDAANISTAANFLTALTDAANALDEEEVPEMERYLYATPALLNSLDTLDTYKSQKILERFAAVKRVPKSRFITSVDLLSGRADDSYAVVAYNIALTQDQVTELNEKIRI